MSFLFHIQIGFCIIVYKNRIFDCRTSNAKVANVSQLVVDRNINKYIY